MASLSSDLVVCWDFDNTITSEDTAVHALSKLDAHAKTMLYDYSGALCWVDFLNELFASLKSKHYQTSAIVLALKSIPIALEIKEVIRLLTEKEIPQYIVSGGNTLFIREALNGHNMLHHFPDSNIFANHSVIHEDQIKISPFCPNEQPHGCERCESYMCKSKIIDELRVKHADCRIIYIGDGANDFCPTLNLTKNDIVLAKHGEKFALGRLWKKKLSQRDPSMLVPLPQVYFWNNGLQLRTIFTTIIP